MTNAAFQLFRKQTVYTSNNNIFLGRFSNNLDNNHNHQESDGNNQNSNI